jgi:TonB family protein
MAFRKFSRCALAASASLLASAFLCASAAAQGPTPKMAQSSSRAKTSAPAAQARPDIFSPSYHPAEPKAHAIPVPTLVYSVDPKFPADAPKGKFSGIAVVSIAVNTDGKPEQVHVVKSLGPEFDKAAVAAVEQYRFRPALQKGKPVPVKVNVEVNFRRY